MGTWAPIPRRAAGRAGDVWVHKYNLIGLLSYYELTADPAVLRACRRMGDLLARTFGDAPGNATSSLPASTWAWRRPACSSRCADSTDSPGKFGISSSASTWSAPTITPTGPRIVSRLLEERQR